MMGRREGEEWDREVDRRWRGKGGEQEGLGHKTDDTGKMETVMGKEGQYRKRGKGRGTNRITFTKQQIYTMHLLILIYIVQVLCMSGDIYLTLACEPPRLT